MAGSEFIRYCGSPIPLSFDEIGQRKEVLLVDVDEAGLQHVTALPVPLFQPLASVKGTLAELGPAIQTAAELAVPGNPVWLEVTVKGDDYLSDLQLRIQALTEGLPADLSGMLRALVDLCGGREVLSAARERLANAPAPVLAALEDLLAIAERLSARFPDLPL